MSKAMRKQSRPSFKLIAVLITAFIAVAALTLPICAPVSGDTSSNGSLSGDMNGDGVVNILDFTLLKLILIGQEPPSELADVDGNGIINLLDLDALLDHIFGKAAFPRSGGGGGGGGSGGGSGGSILANQVNFELSIYQSSYGPGTTSSTFNARVKIAQTYLLNNGSFTVDYDPLTLQVNDVADGLFATTCVINMTDGIDWTDTPGQLTVSPNLSSCAVNGSGVSGSGYLCDITFETRGAGTSPLTLGNGSIYKIQSGNISAIAGTRWTNSSAQITQRYTLTTAVTGTGSASGDGNYNDGSLAAITATETDACWVFDHWTGSDITDVNDPTTTVLIDGDKTVTAVFVQLTYNLTTAVTGTGSASGDGNFNCDTLAAITATETDACWVFDHWTGSDITDVNDPTTTVLIDGDKTVTAVFVQLTYNLTTSADDNGLVTTPGEGVYEHTLSLEAV